MVIKELDLKTNNPLTLKIEVKDPENSLKQYEIIGVDGRSYFRRYTTDNRILINLPIHSRKIVVYVSKGALASILQMPLEFPNLPYIDTPEKFRTYEIEDFKVFENNRMNSPARMYPGKPVIEINREKMQKYPVPVQNFIKYHEVGHYFFDDEIKADTWATITFLNRGYNLSSAWYSLIDVLGKSKENVKRMIAQNKLINEINQYLYK